MTDSHGDDIFILIVEPKVGTMEAVYSTLLKEGYEYGFARSREDAIKIMAARLHDFVITDYGLPGMTGAEFQRILRSSDSKAQIIFTFPGAGASPVTGLKDCKWLGVPFQTADLLTLLN